ncbi:hypothetical protein [Serratia marcescens]|uniref:hypothetical protein n=1 Tax=Serratia marcescens TaxID=615 RepID=UPI003F7FE4DF
MKNIVENQGIKTDKPLAMSYEALKAERDALADRVNALAVENQALNNFIATSCYVWAGEDPDWHPAIDHAPESPATNQLSVGESRFLTDAITAAGLLSHGKQDKGLARRITDYCIAKIGNSSSANLLNNDPATSAALAAIQAQGLEMAAVKMQESGAQTFGDCYIALVQYANELREAK